MQDRVYEFLKQNKKDLLLTQDEKESKKVAEVCRFLGYKTYIFPDLRANFGDDLRSYKEEIDELYNSLREYYNDKSLKKIIVSAYKTILHPLPKKKFFLEKKIEFGDRIDLNSFKEKLYYWGYEFVELVAIKGEVSFRGDIIDIFPINRENPLRISLFDDEIESIKEFDPNTQKSISNEELDSFLLPPAIFSLEKNEYEKLTQKAKELKSDSFEKDIKSLSLWIIDQKEHFLQKYSSIFCKNYENEFEFLDENQKEILKRVPIIDDPQNCKDLAISNINEFLNYHKDKKVTLIARSEALLKQHQINLTKNIKILEKDFIINLICKDEIIISLNKESSKRKKKKATIVLDELKVGDFVVHQTHGIGIFKGLKNTKVLGSVRDFVEIAYQGDDRLLIPVENLEVIDRYIADGTSVAVVDKLGKTSFLKLKEKTRKKLFEIAQKIIDIAAQRELIEAPKIKSDFLELSLFRNDSGFNYTKDQLRAIDEIFADLSSGKTMDRLLSGDVGFGKTEVAMNAIFATVKSGYQAAFIAPTTLLSTQHYKTLKERLSKYDIKVAKLDRFTKASEKKEILKGLKDGSIDVCVGTHSIFGVEFNNLALLVLDEEHKFGVKQKEKLKEFKQNLHILSMSATPIPRSLNMAISSIKGYSKLLTPPSNREDVKTFVKEWDEKLIKEIILREIRRGGQIFYIHNNIASIEEKKKQILEILPNLKILVLHSKISATITEKEMIKFENKEYDLLLSTSIVESGIHIPNVNTIIIENAQNFGMADLHQLRGRVGRSSREGFCFMIVPDKKVLSDEAKKRLLALESNSYLGSGAVLAYHDLEIRGGGNLVGEAQSGHIKGIGYNLYLKMLEETINELLNKPIKQKQSVEIKLSISAFINSEYISEDRLRLELYRRLSNATNVKEIYEIEEEMVDRFGKPDIYTKQFLELLVIKIEAMKKDIVQILSYEQNITFIKKDGAKEYIKAQSKDDDDILKATLKYLKD